jgi:uncharacterized cupredoxin-like copper-binding protein
MFEGGDMKSRATTAFAILLGTVLLIGCRESEPERPSATPTEESATKITVAAADYSFDAPATISGGLVELSFSNRGKELHFAGLAKAAPGKTYEDVKAALTAPPSDTPPTGPPPFEEFAGAPTADPGAGGKMTFNLDPGAYAFFCQIPAPDGISHAAKGMVKELTVTEGTAGTMPQADFSVTATDFAFDSTPALKAGANIVGLRNDGRQLHEINLVELAPDKTVDDVVAWYRQPSGPPPMRSLSGVAVKPGEEGTTTLDLQEGRTYAFICAIPDVLGDFAPHVTKGMSTQPILIS